LPIFDYLASHKIAPMLKIVADDKIPFLRGVLEPYADVVYLPGNKITKDDLSGADALIIRTRTKCNRALLEGSSVKFIGTATIGYDHIDTGYCEKRSIFWTNAPGCNSGSVKQYITAAILKIAEKEGFNPADKCLGIIGVGNVGSKVERVARALGMKVLLNDPPREEREGAEGLTDLDRLVSEADIITVHVPLSHDGEYKTFHLFEKELFGMMKKDAWFINSSRGEVVDTNSLKEALYKKLITGCVIDVWENEPEIDRELLDMAFIATPHIAGYSTDGKANGTAMIVNSLATFFGLHLGEWYPNNVPLPGSTEISIHVEGRTSLEAIAEAVESTYDITIDDKALRALPSAFEKQRGDYRIRREFQAYRVNMNKPSEQLSDSLKGLGFPVIEIADPAS
jgi:erythronate-4-phosphate dehydrogenase